MAISIPPSKHWKGNDGPWSTFFVEVGLPPQILEVLPATSMSLTAVVWPEGCPSSWPANCDTLRTIYDPNGPRIVTRQDYPRYFRFLPEDRPFRNESVNGDIFLNYLRLDWLGNNAEASKEPLPDQFFAGFAVVNPFLGQLGISGRPQAFADEKFNSTLQNLQSKSVISSLTWSYTAGAKYKDPEALGSLTFGGYDPNLVDKEAAITVPFAEDPTYDLSVVIRSI